MKKNVSGTVTELASSALILHKNSTYGINVSVDTNAGKVTVSINSVNGTPVELSVTDDFVKTLKGDIGFSSWGGEYAVDNVKVTAYGIELPGTSTTTPSGVPETPDTGDTIPVAAMAVLAVAAMVIPAVKVKRGAK